MQYPTPIPTGCLYAPLPRSEDIYAIEDQLLLHSKPPPLADLTFFAKGSKGSRSNIYKGYQGFRDSRTRRAAAKNLGINGKFAIFDECKGYEGVNWRFSLLMQRLQRVRKVQRATKRTSKRRREAAKNFLG